MKYDEAVAVFFPARPQGTDVPEAVRAGGPARRLRDAAEPIATHPIWARRVNEAQAELGLDFLTGYVWGRASVLGVPSGGVAASAFAWFEPGLVSTLLAAGQAAARRDVLLAVREREVPASLEEVLAGEDVAPVAERLLAAARRVPPAGRPLYAGLLDLPEPASPAGRLQRACDLVREARGDAHVAVAVAAGIGPVEMNVLTELWHGMELGSYTTTRGWPAEAQSAAVAGLEARGWLAGGALTDAGRSVRARLEAQTDALLEPVVAALGPDLSEVVSALDGWSSRCVQTGDFPADVLKRAAG